MIRMLAFDVEVFRNLFSITYIDVQDYLDKFKDCVNEKGKPIPMTDKLSVAEIKKRLDSVTCVQHYISDTDDNALLTMASYLNNMRVRDVDTIIEGVPYVIKSDRHDLFGFNNNDYDDLIIKSFLSRFNLERNTKSLLESLYYLSKKIIRLQGDKEAKYSDSDFKLLNELSLPYLSVDLMKVYGLHSASVGEDANGNRVKFGKGLKQTAINLKWYELLDFTLPPIDEEEAQYYKDDDDYMGLTLEGLNYSISEFDRYILPKYIPDMLHYNKNDVFLCAEMIRQKKDELKLRYAITSNFNVNVMSSARPNIADKLTNVFYEKFSGMKYKEFKDLRTERRSLRFNEIIFPHIEFKTPQLQALLEDMKHVTIRRTNKSEFERTIEFYGTTYTVATGGIHSQDTPRILKSDEEFVYLHHDYTSYYPSIMISYNVVPAHLNQAAFVNMLSYMKDTRVKCKHTKDEDGYVISGVPNKTGAEALKIVINSIYGKLGSEFSYLYDRLAQMKVTINGQLMTLTLIEELELNGIHVVSANTDGIVIKLPRNKFDVYKAITDNWNTVNKMGADFEEYKILVSRDINNYFDIQVNGDIEFKGAFDPLQYIKDLKKGYDAPIVAKAVFEYFTNSTPVMETLRQHTDILDYCKTQNVGKKFEVIYYKVENGKVVKVKSQRHIRFYVATNGVKIYKEDADGKRSVLGGGLPCVILNTLDDVDIAMRNINYVYYKNEAHKIIDPIMLAMNTRVKASRSKVTNAKLFNNTYIENLKSLFDD